MEKTIANVNGNVTVNCVGVDPRALRVLNKQLVGKNLALSQKIQEANEWANKYHELERQLVESGDATELSKQADEYLHQGELEKAREILDEIIIKHDQRTAANHYKRALIFDLQFEPLKALADYRTAYQLESKELSYGLAYGTLLLKQKQFADARPILEQSLGTVRELAKTNPTAYLLKLADTLNGLGYLYSSIQLMEEAQAAFDEALQIHRELAKSNPATYVLDLGKTLNGQANLYSRTQRTREAQAAYDEALQIFRELAKSNPTSYLPDVAMVLNNLGALYCQTERLKEEQAAFYESLQIHRELAKSNPAAYLPALANPLNSLGNLYSRMQRVTERVGIVNAADQQTKNCKHVFCNTGIYVPYVG